MRSTVLEEESKVFKHYTALFSELSATYEKERNTLIKIAWLRLVVFVGLSSYIYYTYQNLALLAVGSISLLTLFVYLIRRYFDQKDRIRELKKKKNRVESYLKNEVKPNGFQWKPKMHDFAQDLDLLGENSFFEQINFTASLHGEKYLADLMLSNNTQGISQRQDFIQELSEMDAFRLHFSVNSQKKENKRVVDFLESFPGISFANIFRNTLWFFAVSIALMGLTLFDFISYVIPMFWGLIGLFFTGIYFKKVNQFSAKTEMLVEVLKEQVSLLMLIKKQSFSSELGRKIQKDLGDSPYKTLEELLQPISRLDQRNNMLFGVLANAFCLWDIWQMNQIQSWLGRNREQWKRWRTSLEVMDAYQALGEYVFQKEDLIYPNLIEKDTIIFQELGHPMIKRDNLVSNNMKVPEAFLGIITGPNMAGKSTFLRSMGLAVVMANMGLPVRAKTFEYCPLPLISSMRTSDSLMEQASYFHAELHRLQYVLKKALERPYFVLLDEILKGTNAEDKAEGSYRFLKKIHKGESRVFVATHDLSLGVLSEEVERVSNFYFDAVVAEDELVFDYIIRDGVSQNKNASYLMQKMGLVD